MNITAIIQARMTSTRLPGKVLMEVSEKPLLQHQLERLKKAKLLSQIVVAVTTQSADDSIEVLCDKLGIACFRGSEQDVLERYYLCAQKYNAEHIVRITADCPLIDPEVVDKVVGYYKIHYPQYAYVSNTLERTYPRGLDTEIFSFDTLQQAYKQGVKPEEREHVTVYMYKPGSPFTIAQVKNEIDWSHHRWTVDTPQDFELIRNLIESFKDRLGEVTMAECIALLQEKAEWMQLNANIEEGQQRFCHSFNR